ncbi:uncharacterized protein C5orf34 homolog [Hyperolius riggenbachi]|uniref:uncharacterized protein C5orf34 homolog n=1 Tax=Hyperolius riggenbachi TaxID=752182 RepID=UPI0035A2D45D
MEISGDAFLFSDDSVELRCGDGGRLCLSPCGTEFMYERPQPGAHPAHRPQRGRHRTEFTTSSCRDQVLQALSFRNTFSRRPFLPSSLIPSQKKIQVLSEISEVTWPSVDNAEYVTRLEDGGIRISSLDGHAHLHMPALQKDFTVEFLCQLSSTIPGVSSASHEDPVSKEPKTKPRDCRRSRYSSCTLQEASESFVTKHAFQYTWLVQRFSTASCPPAFHYPVSLAFHYHGQHSQQADTQGSAETCVSTANEACSKLLQNGTVSVLPQSLPLGCPATHLHRWNFCNFNLEEQDFIVAYPLPLKAVLYNGVLYRFTLEGSPSLDIYPGDGSVFLSEGEGIGKYFKHYFLNRDKEVEDRLYTVRGLPPDNPRALYSVRSLISQAKRFWELCCSKRLTLNSLSNSCCWEMEAGIDSRAAVPVLLEQGFMPDIGKFAVYSDNMVLGSFLDGVILYMTWSFANFNKEKEVADSVIGMQSTSTYKHRHVGLCRLQLSDGSSELVELESPGQYASYVRAAVAWCRWLDERSQSTLPAAPIAAEHWSVEAELKKIQRFQSVLESGSAGSRGGDINLPSRPGADRCAPERTAEMNIQSILEKTSKAIRDIDILLSSRK